MLFYLPVTQAWIRPFVLALILIGHSSLRGVTELLRDLFDYHLSVGTAHNIVEQAVATARQINDRQDLSRVRIGADDEIFQASRPVLVGIDTESTSCSLLRQEEHRDADTWGVRLLELVDRGFDPEATLADFASGLRAGPEQALPGVACRGDVFPAWYELGPLVRYLENRAYEAIDTRTKLERKQAAAERRQGRKERALAQKLCAARRAEAKAITLAGDVAVLARWLRKTSCRWPDRSPPSAASCTTSSRRNCASASRPVPIGSNPCGNCWRTSGTTSWPSPWNWTVIWRLWPSSGRSGVRPLERSWKCKPCRCATRGAGGARRRCERH